MRNRRQQFAAVVLVASLLLSAATVAAQNQTNDWSRVTTLSGGTKLSVKLESGKSINGEFRTASDSTLSLTVKNAPTEVRRDEVATVHEVTKKSAAKATLIVGGSRRGSGSTRRFPREQKRNQTSARLRSEIAGRVLIWARVSWERGRLARIGSARGLLRSNAGETPALPSKEHFAN